MLVYKVNGINQTVTVENNLSRLRQLSSTVRSVSRSTSMRISLMVSQISALRWCLSGSLVNCLTELDNATQVESALFDDSTASSLVTLRSGELFALYLLITHRNYSKFASAYVINGRILSVIDFPSYALNLYQKANRTAPHRAVNSLGTARAYVQMGQISEANKLYRMLLQQWSNASCRSNVNQMVINEANDYLLGSKKSSINKAAFLRIPLFTMSFLTLLCFSR